MSREVTEWVAKHDDQNIPTSVKERIARKAGDACQRCRRPISGKLRAEFDHITPLILGGKHAESNLQLLCNECHSAKTKLDLRLKAKVARVRKRHLGITKARTITRWRRFDGSIREAGRER